MTKGRRYEAIVDEWATIIGAPKACAEDLDVYSDPKTNHNSMANTYKRGLNDYLLSHKLGSIYFLQAGITTTNTILRHTLMHKSGDDKMIRGHSINLLHHLDTDTRFKVMDLIVETIRRIVAD